MKARKTHAALPVRVLATVDNLITASLIMDGHALALVREVEHTRAKLQKLRRYALDASSARNPGQAALRCVDKVLRVTAP